LRKIFPGILLGCWPLLAARIEQFLQGSAPCQAELFALADDVGQLLEAVAERYSELIIAKLAQPVAIATPEEDYHRVNIDHIEAVQARGIGAETLACHAVRQLQLDQKLTALGFNKIDSAAALGSIIGRMVSPGSELQTHNWLQSRTGLGACPRMPTKSLPFHSVFMASYLIALQQS